MPTQKKSFSKRSSTRDISLKKPLEETFSVHRIETRPGHDVASVEPLQDQNHYEDQKDLEDAMEEVLESEDLMHQAKAQEQEEETFSEITHAEPKDFVKVRFSKFVQLVASHDCDEVLKNNENEEVVLSSNLLTELAGAHDEREERKIPIIFLVGLAIGVVLTYILLNK